MKKHSQRLNIKTTRLASLTAVFHSKRRRPPATDNPHLSAMDVDEEGPLQAEPGGQVDGLETIPEESATQPDSSETDNNNGGNSDGTSEGLLMDSDSGDEFESDEENIGGCRDGAEKGQGLEFELRAAEAGSVLC